MSRAARRAQAAQDGWCARCCVRAPELGRTACARCREASRRATRSRRDRRHNIAVPIETRDAIRAIARRLRLTAGAVVALVVRT